MKKARTFIALFFAACMLSSCATVFGGGVNQYQRTKPAPGQSQRKVRAGAMIADILLFWPGLIVDFATCAIYKPHPPEDANPAQPTPVEKTVAQAPASAN